MTLTKQIKNDLMQAMKTKDEDLKRTLRVLIGELQRTNHKIELLSDKAVVGTIRSLLKAENMGSEDEQYFNILRTYLPKQLNEQEIKTWIINNVDFSQLKNKMQAVGMVIKQFGGLVDGKSVKSIVQKIEG